MIAHWTTNPAHLTHLHLDSPCRPIQHSPKARPGSYRPCFLGGDGGGREMPLNSSPTVSSPPRRRAIRAIPNAFAGSPPSRCHALGLSSPMRNGHAEPDAALPQVPRRAAARPRAGRGTVAVRRGKGSAGGRDGLAAALRPPLRAPQHRRPLRLQVPPPHPTPTPLSHLVWSMPDGSFSTRSSGI